MTAPPSYLNLLNDRATAWAGLASLTIDLQVILHGPIQTQGIAIGPNGGSTLFDTQLQDPYGLRMQPLDFGLLQLSG